MHHDVNAKLELCLPLVKLGWSAFFQHQLDASGDVAEAPVEPARVAAGGRGVLHVLTASGPRLAVVSGRLLHETQAEADLPAVGDWVGLRPSEAQGHATITRGFLRRTCLLRKEAGKRTSAQVLAANIDTVMIVTSLNAEFNPRRLERYVEAVLESGARPVLVLNKIDLCDAPAPFFDAALSIGPTLPLVGVSALSGSGMDALLAHVREGETIAFVGSSGVGKSTIVNRLLGAALQREGAIREDDDRGRHTTAHRELFPLPSGGLLMDTPGLRELELWASADHGPAGFDDVLAAAAGCRFRDCSHRREPGCGVERAVKEGTLDPARVASFHKLEAERSRAREKLDGRARLDEKRRYKQIVREMRHHPKR